MCREAPTSSSSTKPSSKKSWAAETRLAGGFGSPPKEHHRSGLSCHRGSRSLGVVEDLAATTRDEAGGLRAGVFAPGLAERGRPRAARPGRYASGSAGRSRGRRPMLRLHEPMRLDEVTSAEA